MMMGQVEAALYGGSQVDWFPIWLSDLWRILLWCSIFLWIGKMLGRIWDRGEESGSVYWLRFCVLIFFVRQVWVQAHNWNDPIAWDGVPITTLAMICAWMSVYRYHHDKQPHISAAHARTKALRKHEGPRDPRARTRASDNPKTRTDW